MIIEENRQHKEEVYAMWQRNFHDPAPYAAFYFSEVYGKNEVLLQVSENNVLQAADMQENRAENTEETECIKGMLHLNPYQLLIKGKTVDAHYIVGVATDERFRRQGVMRELLIDTFSRLRKRGEMFTYLMPADENYYLPFDFRFGMCQLEQEMECFRQAPKPEKKQFAFVPGLPENLEEACRLENEKKAGLFAICTKMTSEYFRRLEKEVRSDFGRMITVYKDGIYAGRFVMGAEDGYMVLSQIVCVDETMYQCFLHEALHFSEEEYHYGKYQLIVDETWKKTLLPPGNVCGVRLLPVKEKKIIMFRILDLEKLGAYLCGTAAQTCCIRVIDNYLQEQDGCYQWSVDNGKVKVQKISHTEGSTTPDVPDGGSITIAALAELIFGKKETRTEQLFEGLTQKGKNMLEGVQPLSFQCIQEIV